MSALARHELGLPAGPTLALFHGNGDSGLCWPGAVRRWGAAYRVCALDARGHGASPRFTAAEVDRAGELFTDDAEQVLEDLVADGSRVVAVGHSLGAASLTAVLARRPDLLAGAVLIDPPWDTPLVRGPRPEVGAARVELIRGYQADPEAALAGLRERHPEWAEAECEAWVEAKLHLDLALMASGNGRPATPWTELVPVIRTPTLVLTGDDEGCLVGPATREVLTRCANPAVTLEVIAGADHYVRQTREAAFHAVVDPWLAARF